jgi:hypothetical protein
MQTTYYIQTAAGAAVYVVTAHTEADGGREIELRELRVLPTLQFNLTCPLNEAGEREVREFQQRINGPAPLFDEPVAMRRA